MKIVQAVYFLSSKAGKFKNLDQNSEKKSEYCHFSQRNHQKKLKRLKFYRDFKDVWKRRTQSPSEYYCPEDLETFDTETETGFTESQEAIEDFINQQKSANTNKKTATDMNTLFHYMEAYMVYSEVYSDT